MTPKEEILDGAVRYVMNALDNITDDREKAAHREIREVLGYALKRAEWAE